MDKAATLEFTNLSIKTYLEEFDDKQKDNLLLMYG